jgi:hypothetical protein
MQLSYVRWATTLAIFCMVVAYFPLPQTTRGQAPPPPLPLDPLAGQPQFATVSLGLGKIVNPQRHKVTFEKVGLEPQQIVAVTLQYPVALAGRPASIEPLDGGKVITSGQNLIIGADGTLRFEYQAGANPGLYQIRVHYDVQAIALQFWVFDHAHLDNTPPVLTVP